MLTCLCLTSYLNSSITNHHPACLISSNSTTPLSPVCSTNMHHSSQNQSRHDNLMLGSLHTHLSAKSHDVAWKEHGNDRATSTMLCAFDSSPISIITRSPKLKKSISHFLNRSKQGSAQKALANCQYHSSLQTYNYSCYFSTYI